VLIGKDDNASGNALELGERFCRMLRAGGVDGEMPGENPTNKEAFFGFGRQFWSVDHGGSGGDSVADYLTAGWVAYHEGMEEEERKEEQSVEDFRRFTRLRFLAEWQRKAREYA
jgi:hypothetical protein